MSFPPDTNKSSILSPQQLRKYLFDGARAPFWNYDKNELSIGIEIEYFIGRETGPDYFRLASKSDFLKVVDHLKQNFLFVDEYAPKQPGRVSKNTSRGFVVIKPDFAWHILEIALPPRHTIDEIEIILTTTLKELDASLAFVGLKRLDFSCLPFIPSRIELVDLDRLDGHIHLLQDHATPSIYSTPMFPALIAATHVHLNVLDESIFAILPELYSFEPEARTRFTREQTFLGVSSNEHRENFYKTNLGDRYLLADIPKIIPRSITDYANLYSKSEKLFPNDPFFGVRDLTAIRPTRYGTLEFRSACSFINVASILDIAKFRVNQFLSSWQRRTNFNVG